MAARSRCPAGALHRAAHDVADCLGCGTATLLSCSAAGGYGRLQWQVPRRTKDVLAQLVIAAKPVAVQLVHRAQLRRRHAGTSASRERCAVIRCDPAHMPCAPVWQPGSGQCRYDWPDETCHTLLSDDACWSARAVLVTCLQCTSCTCCQMTNCAAVAA